MKTNMTDHLHAFIRTLFAIVIFGALYAFAQQAQAARTINDVTLDGDTVVTVAPGAVISARVAVTLTLGSSWSCTSWRIGNSGPYTSVTHGTNSAWLWGQFIESFTVPAPSMPGTYSISFRAHSSSTCNSTETAYSMSQAIIVVTAAKIQSIVRADPSPAKPGTAVSWTVTYDKTPARTVTAADFVLAANGVTGASITSVTGSGMTWTVMANTGSGVGTLGLNAANGSITGQVYDVQNTSADCEQLPGMICHCDNFSRTSLNPSTIYGSNWIVSKSDATSVLPSIAAGRLRLTENSGDNAKAATVPGIFPARGNYILVEFQHYAYGGCAGERNCSGADGIAVTLSDYSTPAVPGAFGGSLGYAQKTRPAVSRDVPGFNGGWIGVAIDEFGNYQNPTEGRIGGPGARAQSVGVRGSGSGVVGYAWLGGTASLSPNVDNSTSSTARPGHRYQVIVDARNDPASTSVVVNRNTGSGYQNLVNISNVYATAKGLGFNQAPVPENWQISFTGSTGGATNIHEIDGLRICATTMFPPGGGAAKGFNAIDEGYGSLPLQARTYLDGHIYTKIAGKPFNLNIAALTELNQLQTVYAKKVTVNLVDNSDGACILDNASPAYCSKACTGKPAVEGGSIEATFDATTDKGQKQFGPFVIPTAYRNLVAIVRDDTTTACSTDAFSVRPEGIASVAFSSGDKTTLRADGDTFSLTAVTTGVTGKRSGYDGVLKISNDGVQAHNGAPAVGLVTGTFEKANPGTGASVASGKEFRYNEVGTFLLWGDDPLKNFSSPRGIFDGVHTASECKNEKGEPLSSTACDVLRKATWTGVDSVSTRADCVADSYQNVKDDKGRYGCNFGLLGKTAAFGRFTPDHFELSKLEPSEPTLTNRSDIAGGAGCTPPSMFTYMGEPFRLKFKLTAMSGTGRVTKNYTGDYAKLVPTEANWLRHGAAGTLGLWMAALENPVAGGMCDVYFSGATPSSTTFKCTGTPSPAAIARAAGPRVALVANSATMSAWADGTSTFSASLLLERADRPDGPYGNLQVGIAPRDEDGITMQDYDMDADNNGTDERQLLATTAVRYGRLQIPNSYGSELLDLPLQLRAQYWGGSGYLNSADDNCSPLVAANFVTEKGPGAAITTKLSGGGTAVGGASLVRLARPDPKPTAKGSVTVKSSTIAPVGWPLDRYLPGVGTETFGVYRGGPVIYRREIY